ncbi:hypothetical protein BWK62_10885 [Flavobacterium oreochromis]|uniref:Uncharacterized protein n=3 Tax=Flavobacterium TaxID=237 RepID=A0A246G931_9FLAO|nr:hypothetical protein BWK62_10885 [Flavobacterium oreochromis]
MTVMVKILITGYEYFIENNSIASYIRTNISVVEIENLYDNRLCSRMREMFNLIIFNSFSYEKNDVW